MQCCCAVLCCALLCNEPGICSMLRSSALLCTRLAPCSTPLLSLVPLAHPPPHRSTGYITPALLKEHMPPPSDDSLVLVCGPPPMMKALSGDKLPDKSQGPLTGGCFVLGGQGSSTGLPGVGLVLVCVVGVLVHCVLEATCLPPCWARPRHTKAHTGCTTLACRHAQGSGLQ